MTFNLSKSNIIQPDDPRISQIIDANLDRAREGLRVLEDWARFGLGKQDFVIKIKNYRQILGKNHLDFYKKARNFSNDKCRGLSHDEQMKRKSPENIISSNSARVQEALRVVEEYSRSHNFKLSQISSEIRYEIYNLEVELLNSQNRKDLKIILNKNNLYSLTNHREDLLGIIEKILSGGVKIIQHRFKEGKDKDHLKEAIAIRQICNKYNSLFIINDRVDIALASNADGVHLGQEDLDINTARKLLGDSKIIGISANNKKDIADAVKNGCDYIGIGPVFKSTTKSDKNVIGIEGIKNLTRNITVPWFAIGGINKNNISFLKKHGIKKIAIVSGLLNSQDPREEAIIILKELANEN